MKYFKIIYSTIGIVLVILLVLTYKGNISEADKNFYKRACSLEEDIQKNIWNGVSIKNHPVAIRKGNNEYVFFNDNIEKRKAIIPVYACSVYPVDNVINILIPCYEDMNKIGDIVEGISDSSKLIKSQFGFSNSSISENQYISIYYHEAFHAYQLSRFKKHIYNMFNEDIFTSSKQRVIEEIDTKDSLKNLYKREGELLYLAITEKDTQESKKYINEYIAAREKRTELLKNTLSERDFTALMDLENYYELLEGTARYVEVKTLLQLKDNDMYSKHFEMLKDFSQGTEKYYKSGMAMSVILDRFNINWKSDMFLDEKPLYYKFLNILRGK